MSRPESYEEIQSRAFHDNAAAYDEAHVKKFRTFDRKARIIAAAIRAAFPGEVKILEIGCGPGFLTTRLAHYLPRATFIATDCYQPMLDLAAKRLKDDPRVELRIQDACQPLPAGLEYDMVCGMDVIHHLEDPVGAMRHWRAAAHAGSRLCFSEGNPKNPVLYWRLRDQLHEERFFLNSRDNFTSWLTEAGWVKPRVENMPMYLPPGPAWMAPLTSGAEDVLHMGRALWGRFSGSYLVQASVG